MKSEKGPMKRRIEHLARNEPIERLALSSRHDQPKRRNPRGHNSEPLLGLSSKLVLTSTAVTEASLVAGFVWVLFVKPEPIVG